MRRTSGHSKRGGWFADALAGTQAHTDTHKRGLTHKEETPCYAAGLHIEAWRLVVLALDLTIAADDVQLSLQQRRMACGRVSLL